MENNLEEYLAKILKDMKLERQKTSFCYPHGSKKGDEVDYYTYFDIHRGVWTTYEKAVHGYILIHLQPTIDKIIKEI